MVEEGLSGEVAVEFVGEFDSDVVEDLLDEFVHILLSFAGLNHLIMCNCYRIVYGKNAVFYWRCDTLLSSFGCKAISRGELSMLSQGIPEFQEILAYLSDEGFVDVGERSVAITARGILFVGWNGFKGEARRKMARAFCGIVGALAAVCTIVAALA